MEQDQHGLCLIINNEKFKDGRHRSGSQIDVLRLKNLFTELGFDCSVEQDLTETEMTEILTEFAEDDRHIKSEMMILVILSHGSLGKIETIDGKEVSFKNNLKKKFNLQKYVKITM